MMCHDASLRRKTWPRRHCIFTPLAAIAIAHCSADLLRAEPTEGIQGLIDLVRRVGPEGKGSREAARAWRALAKLDVDQLPLLLAGMDGANSLARNWLRSAIDHMLEQARVAKKPLPNKTLEQFLLDTSHDPQARRFAYELLVGQDHSAIERFLPNMVDDPAPELRRDAIARLMDQADKASKAKKTDEAITLYRTCLDKARDTRQIEGAARDLRELGQTVDLPQHYGMIQDWKVIGPFRNDKGKQPDIVYPPEKEITLSASYDGLAGPVKWTNYLSKDAHGIVDLDAALSKSPEATGYALTQFTSPRDMEAEIRIGCYSVFRLWLNGELILARGDAFTGMAIDHYVTRAHLRQGKNIILMKVCRENYPGVPNLWRFQLRICRPDGVAILSTTRPRVPSADSKKPVGQTPT